MNKVWRKIFKIVLKEKKIVFWFLFWIILVGVLDATYPLFNAYVLDNYFADDTTLPYFVPMIIYYFSGGIIYALAIRGFLLNGHKVEAIVGETLRKEAFEKIEKLSFSYFDNTPSGWLMARMTADSRKLSEIISWGLVDFVWGMAIMVGVIIVMFCVNWTLALIVIGIVPILLVFCYICNKIVLKRYREAREQNSVITTTLSEGLLGGITSKTLVIEEDNNKEFKTQVYGYRKVFMRSVVISSIIAPVVFLICYIGTSLTLFAGVSMSISVATLYLFIDSFTRFFDPINSIAKITCDFQNAQAAAERIINLIETEPSITDSKEVVLKYGDIFTPKYENYETLNGDIEFKNVGFKYENGKEVLKDFNLQIKAGTSVALVGRTGSGKTTIVNLLSRFYEPTSGSIYIDGIDYKEKSIGYLHSNIGYVLQTPQLFSGTILENIKYGKPDATMDEVIEAVKLVNAYEFIMSQPNGFDTVLKEGGTNLSVGERQLISFARAVISNPRILILDEATSSIDTLKEKEIKDALSKMLAGRTSFIIAHRLSTIVNSDLILVIDDGKIVEAGTHNELLHKYGYYFELYKNQFLRELDESTM